uniref:Protein SLOW GREEN 1, chloroplastic n=1 Tax=Kalanchoe fedtschenkoi TaxID=63787 RepID=A0A7N0ULE5_KALFE
MISGLATASSSSFALSSPLVRFSKPNSGLRGVPAKLAFAPIRASGGGNDGRVSRVRIVEKLRKAAGVVVLTAVTTAMIGKFGQFPARAEIPMATVSEEAPADEDKASEVVVEENGEARVSAATPLAELLQTNTEAVEVLKALLQQRLENGEDEEALKIVDQLVEARPEVAEWKYLRARILNEMDLTDEARNAFEEILKADPLNYEALFENALLMNRRGEGEAVSRRLEEALRLAEGEGKGKEARDVRLIIAQMKFLQNDVNGALSCYDELIREDPNDFRPHFSKGMIYSLTDRNDEAKEEFAKYKQLAPKKFEVEGFLRTPLSRMLFFGTSNPDQI